MKNDLQKRSNGTLFHREMTTTHGSVRFYEKPLTKKEKIRRAVGAGLTSVSLALFFYSYGPIVSEQLTLENPKPEIKATNVVSEVSAKSEVQPTTQSVEESTRSNDYQLSIPFLKVTSKVFVNIDPSNEGEYNAALGEGVAQAQGTGLPGQNKRIFLFAHSTNSPLFIQRYNAIFYNLEKLPMGEKIEIINGDKTFKYEVFDRKIVNASDTSWLAPRDGEELVLQTCWPAGTNWKRLLVFAKPY